MPLLGEKPEVIERAYWIDNPMLAKLFESSLETTAAMHKLNPSEFLKQSWKGSDANSQRKAEYLKKLEQHIENGNCSLGWQNKHKVPFLFPFFAIDLTHLTFCLFPPGARHGSDPRDLRKCRPPHCKEWVWDCGDA